MVPPAKIHTRRTQPSKARTRGEDEALELQRKLRGGEAGIVAVGHEQRPRVAPVAVKGHRQRRRGRDGRHHANLQPFLLQKRTLRGGRVR